MTEGTVRALATEDSKDCFGVYLAEQADGSGGGIELQRAHSFDEQDRRLGQDTYCIVLDGTAHYGGIVSWGLGGGVLVLSLDRAASEALGVDEEIRVDLQVDSPSVQALADGLARVLVNVPRNDEMAS